jgi:predicted Zn-ribbon and HTH transcriptional regulator
MAEITMRGYRCERCGHEWVPRQPGQKPTVCPKCKSPFWNKPRKDAATPARKKSKK